MRKFYTLLALGLFSLSSFAAVPNYCLDNEKVAGYFSTQPYNDNDYSYTYITDYCYRYPWNWENLGDGKRYDRPLPAKVQLSKTCTVVATLTVTEDGDYEDAAPDVIKTVPAGAQSIDVYNLIPNRSYSWVLKDASTQELIEQGSFTTSGHVRMLMVEGIFNVRDMGGYSTMGGTHMKYGKIIRGSRLNINGSSKKIITDEGIEELLRLGVLAELDMRDESNAPMEKSGARHSYLGDDIPIANFTGAYASRIATFADAPHSIRGIKQMIAWFKEDRPVYLHCSVGADRTGTVAYLVGALCGMSEDALARDFELTSFSADTVDNEADRGTWEVLVRQRTNVGRLDQCSSPESYRFSDMVAKIKSFEGGTFQRKVYNHLLTGVNGESISADDLSFLVKYLTGYSILGKIICNVDTIELEVGETKKITFTPFPADAQYEKVTFKSTCEAIATVASDGTVTAVGGGMANIIVDVDGVQEIIPVLVPIDIETATKYTIENEAVSKYMKETHYSDNDYSVSTVEQYTSIEVPGGRADWPASVKIKWVPFAGAKNVHLTVSENPEYDVNISDNIVDTDLQPTDSTYTISAVEPQRLYFYKVTGQLKGGNVILISSAFIVDSYTRMLQIRSIYNVRDLGGWIGMNGNQVRCGVLYRGSRLRYNNDQGDLAGKVMISKDDIKLMTGLGIKAELDLRSDSESSATKSALNSMLYKFKRVADADQYLGASIAHGDAYVVALKQIIEWLKLEKNGSPVVPAVYISGTLGAERTGALAFLINGLLGVSEEDLAKDYELSTFSGDKLGPVVCKRNTGNYPAMVAGIKVLNGETLQHKIFKYFNEGINGTSIAKDDLVWFISYMLDCPEDEIADSYLTKVTVIPTVKIEKKIYNLLGQEVTNPGPGVYIMDGKKYIINE